MMAPLAIMLLACGLLAGTATAMPWNKGTQEAEANDVVNMAFDASRAATPFDADRLPQLSQAKATLSTDEPSRWITLPISRWEAGGSKRIEKNARMVRKVYRLDQGFEGTAPLADALAEALHAAGYDLLFSCQSRSCGGFDFRFALDVAAPPLMHVDLGDYHYILASRSGQEGPEHVMALVSRSGKTGFVQIDRILPPDVGGPAAPPVLSTSNEATAPMPGALQAAADPTGDLGEILLSRGAAVLEGIRFKRGSASLEEGAQAPSIAALAKFLRTHPEHRVMLVGHTDATGSLAGNMALSRKRAEAVRRRLINEYGIAPSVIAADGAGFLAPRAPNTSEEGRSLNRRVEAILLK